MTSTGTGAATLVLAASLSLSAAIARRGRTELNHIVAGKTHRIKQGDAVLVPAGWARWHTETNLGITSLEVRFIAPPEKQ